MSASILSSVPDDSPGATRGRILITSNPLNHEGGVVAFCNLLFQIFPKQDLELVHHTVGSRPEYFYASRLRTILYPLYFIADIWRLWRRLKTDPSIRIVHVNPSLITLPLIRDAIILALAHGCKRQTVMFIHGWRDPVYESFRYGIRHRLFTLLTQRVDGFIVLAERFREKLIALGVPPDRISVVSTMFLADHIPVEHNRTGQPPRFLYLGRISELKGCREILEAASRLRQRGVHFELWMAGHGDRGSFLQECHDYVAQHDLQGEVHFLGRLDGEQKFDAYSDSDIYVFPSWSEGCPTTVLEAMSTGMFTLATPVGALPEVLRDQGVDGTGTFVPLRDPDSLAAKMAWAVQHIGEIRAHRKMIQREALQRFEANVVIRQLEQCYRDVLQQGMPS